MAFRQRRRGNTTECTNYAMSGASASCSAVASVGRCGKKLTTKLTTPAARGAVGIAPGHANGVVSPDAGARLCLAVSPMVGQITRASVQTCTLG